MKGFLKFFVAFIGGFMLGAWCMCQIDKKNKDRPPIDSEFEDDDIYDDDGIDYSDLGLDDEPEAEAKVEEEVIERDEKEVADSVQTPSEKLTEDDVFNLNEEEIAEAKSKGLL